MERRLNWGSGPLGARGWINADRSAGLGVDVVHDIRERLPLRDGSIEYAASMHALQNLPYLDVLPALGELHRVLRPGGALRLGLPDLERAIAAYARRDASHFHVGDDHAKSLGGKLVAQIVWYGSSRTPFTPDMADELLARAGFSAVWRARYRETGTPYPGIVALDNQPAESFFVEAIK